MSTGVLFLASLKSPTDYFYSFVNFGKDFG